MFPTAFHVCCLYPLTGLAEDGREGQEGVLPAAQRRGHGAQAAHLLQQLGRPGVHLPPADGGQRAAPRAGGAGPHLRADGPGEGDEHRGLRAGDRHQL